MLSARGVTLPSGAACGKKHHGLPDTLESQQQPRSAQDCADVPGELQTVRAALSKKQERTRCGSAASDSSGGGDGADDEAQAKAASATAPTAARADGDIRKGGVGLW